MIWAPASFLNSCETRVQLSVRSFALTCGLFFAGTVTVVGGAGLVFPGYGQPVLELFASLYPGYTADGTVADWLMGIGLALIDGIIGGLAFAWLYNRIVAR